MTEHLEPHVCTPLPPRRYEPDDEHDLAGVDPVAVAAVAEADRRRRAGICRDCDAPVSGARGRALRCAEHCRSHRRKVDAAEHSRNRAPVIRCKACGEPILERTKGRPSYHATAACHPRVSKLMRDRATRAAGREAASHA
jgi:hypothetical protein